MGTFWTFCLAESVGLDVNANPYHYSVDTTVQPAGSYYNYVSLGTAWLWGQYRIGAVGNGTATDDPINDALQAAIWYLQGNGNTVSGLAATYVSDATTAITLLGKNVSDNANGAYDAYAMNLWHTDAAGAITYSQPMLAVPEPSTVVAGALLLLPFGVSTLRILRKKQVS